MFTLNLEITCNNKTEIVAVQSKVLCPNDFACVSLAKQFGGIPLTAKHSTQSNTTHAVAIDAKNNKYLIKIPTLKDSFPS